jgi:uncharacterized cupin superfamily protein
MQTRRRVVTGHNATGQSVIVQNGPSPGRLASIQWDELWAFDRLPADLADPHDPAARDHFRLTPEADQIACRLFTVYPIDTPDREASNAEWDAHMDYAETEAGAHQPGEPWMHRTPTIDIIVIVSGEMDLALDSGERQHLLPGDSVVQRGTMHAWSNTGTEPCLAVAFMARAQ